MNMNKLAPARLLTLILAVAAFAIPAAARTPNLIFILADDLGYAQLGCFGSKLIQTPHLDQMAAEGAKFTRFYAGSTVCAPSRSVLMTGLHTGKTRVRGNAPKNNRALQDLRSGDVTVAQVLQKVGYSTALIGKWGIGHEGSEGTPNRKGFDYFYGYLDQFHAHNPYPPFIIRQEERVALRNRTIPGSAGPDGDALGAGVAQEPLDFVPDLMADEVMKWIEKEKEKPFFLYWSLITPHANNEGKKFDRGQEIPDLGPYADRDWEQAAKAHAATITRLDADVGRLFALLKKLGIDQDTLVVFSSDNGAHKEGGFDPAFFDVSGPLQGIKRSLHDGGIRVPTIMRWPGKIAPGGEVNTPLWFADILPTFAELAGAAEFVPSGLDGVSFAKPLQGMRIAWPGNRTLYWEFHEGGFSQALLIDGKWKAIRLKRPQAPIAIYDLDNDIGEKIDLAGSQPALVARAQALFESERIDSPDWPIRDPRTP
jgi:arylsulfatase A-like enzyme